MYPKALIAGLENSCQSDFWLIFPGGFPVIMVAGKPPLASRSPTSKEPSYVKQTQGRMGFIRVHQARVRDAESDRNRAHKKKQKQTHNDKPEKKETRQRNNKTKRGARLSPEAFCERGVSWHACA